MEIQDIKNSLTLATVLHHYNLKPDKQHRLKCPFHDDKTPSMQVYYKTHTCYCFSSNCKTHGKSLDVIDFVMFKEECNKHEAIKKAVELLAFVSSDKKNKKIGEQILGGESKSSTKATIQNTDPNRSIFLEKMFTYFKNAIHNSKPAQEYLKNRCLDFQKIEVGYNSGQFHHGTRKDENLIHECLKYGLLLDLGLKARTGETAYKPFGKLGVCFPLKNKENQLVSLYFRSTLDDKAQRHFYLKDRQGLYPSYPNPSTKTLILTESIIDCASLQSASVLERSGLLSCSLLSLFGTNGLTEEHAEAIRNLKELEEIIFFLNGDEPGIKAVEKYASMLKSEYPNIKITSVEVPHNEDVNSLLQSHDKEILNHLIDTRKEYTFLFSSEENSIENPIEKEKSTNFTMNEVEMLNTNNLAERSHEHHQKNLLNVSNPHNLHYTGQAAAYYIKGFKSEQLDSLKVTLQTKIEQYFYSSKLDLYEHKQLENYTKEAAKKLQLDKESVEGDLHQLTNLLEHYRDKQHFEKQQRKESKIQVTNQTATKCIEFLKQENLIQAFNKVIEKTGITGEETNRILLFIIASSYKMPDTLHALIQGSSGSGKTRLLKIISHLMPDEDVKRYTRVTDNSFYNQDEYFFVNKLLCFEDMDGLKEDAQLAVRELQSNEILITSTSIKDTNGSIRGGERIVRGPIASLSCTTKGETYEDNISRCFLIAVDESREQTLRIINYQNELSAGLIDKEEQKQKTIFVQNCMRLLKSYEVINPYANKIKLPEQAHKIRRLNELYQSFVKQITLLNQYQRKQDKQGRLITEKQDLQTACDILFESIVLKVDELDGQLRGFYEKLKKYILPKGKDYEFTQREVRQFLNISKAQCSRYFYSLQSMEYITAKFTGNQRKMCYVIDFWDNYAKLRAQIKDDINKQIEVL
jgi:DNA primase/energy-coupling factor transporter ATP-binding protein EcfA2